MKVIISVGGQFHAFALACQLHKANALEKLITSSPFFKVRKIGIPLVKIKSRPLKEIIYRGWELMPSYIRKRYNQQYLACELFDRGARRQIKDCDLLVGWSSFCLHSLREAKRRGAITIVERGSSHILHQTKILEDEYERFVGKVVITHPKTIRKELDEYEEADYVSIPSQFVRRSFLQQGFSKEKLIQVPYGVDLSGYRQVTKEDGVFRVIFAGNICLRKGIHYLLKAFSELKLPGSEMLLIGSVSEEMKPFLKQYEGTYTWIGKQPPKKLYRYYSQGSVFVMPSIEEGLAMVQLQAMACGLPLICTTNTGGEDIIEDGKDGFVIPIRDVEALKEKLLFLYRHPALRRAMGESAKKKVEQGFSWDDYGRRMIENYRIILEGDEEKQRAKVLRIRKCMKSGVDRE